VPTESPTLGLSHLPFEALLTASRRVSADVRFRSGEHGWSVGVTDLRGMRCGHRRCR
jgi:hypothetical protein